MQKKHRKQYIAEFKAKVVKEMLKEEKTIEQLAAEYECIVICSIGGEIRRLRDRQISEEIWQPRSKLRKRQSQRKRSGKPSGGQVGHSGHHLAQVKQAEFLIRHRPQHCQHCQSSLEGAAGEVVERRQAHDLPSGNGVRRGRPKQLEAKKLLTNEYYSVHFVENEMNRVVFVS